MVKILGAIKRLITAFFIAFVFKPSKSILKFIFYKIIVKSYVFYRSLLNKLGWHGPRESSLSFLFNQKLVHIFVVILTFIIVFTNLIAKTKAGTITDNAQKAILANLVQNEFGDLEEEEFIEEFLDEETLLSSTNKSYLDTSEVLSNKPQTINVIDLEENLEDIASITQGSAAIIKPEIASTQKIKRPRKEVIEYTVQAGDSVSTIAQEFDISVNSILWENNLTAYSLIRPGDKLKILPYSGVSHEIKKGENITKIASIYGVKEEDILTANKITNANEIKIGQKLLIPDGIKPKPTPVYVARSNYTGIAAIKSIVTPAGAVPTSNKMNWPTEGHRITQYYSWKHTGLDVANKVGTPIYAADAGTIELAGWNNGYGNNIIVNHGGGKKTRYAHLSQFYVSKGETVSKGAAIGAMGNTGWSTGPHLHFEVVINGVKYNPLNYIQ